MHFEIKLSLVWEFCTQISGKNECTISNVIVAIVTDKAKTATTQMTAQAWK
jgi:hypothetical protein